MGTRTRKMADKIPEKPETSCSPTKEENPRRIRKPTPRKIPVVSTPTVVEDIELKNRILILESNVSLIDDKLSRLSIGMSDVRNTTKDLDKSIKTLTVILWFVSTILGSILALSLLT